MTQVNMSTCFLLHSYCYFNIDLLFHVTKKKRCIFMKNKKPNSYAASISLRKGRSMLVMLIFSISYFLFTKPANIVMSILSYP